MANPKHLDLLKQGCKEGYSAWNRWRKEEPETQADLNGADLRGIIRKRAGVRLNGANLTGANLSETDLTNVSLFDANLTQANLSGATLKGVNFKKANFSNANLTGADLRYAQLRQANLDGANLSRVNLKGTLYCKEIDFSNIDLSYAILNRADLSKSLLKRANLNGAILEEAILNAADFSGANLSGANLRKANLQEANLSRANLSYADLRLANMTYANLDYATLSNAILWETQRTGWSIKHVICTQVYWDENAQKATKYLPGQFSYLLAEKTKLVLYYEGGIKPIEVATLPSLIQQLESEHEGCILMLESIKVAPDGAIVTIIVDVDEGYNVKQLEHSLTECAKQEQAWRRKALENYELRMQLERQLIELNNLYLPLAKKRQESDPSLFQNCEEYLMVLFLDVAGFSRMNDVDRQEKVARLRDFGVPVLLNRGGKYINTWGDAIVAAFDDVNKGLICACQLISHLAIQGIPARIGANRGKVFINYNSLTQRPDVSGSTVNFAARLEPLAQKGEVLISEELRYEPTLDSNLFNFMPQKRALKKGLEGIEAGEFVDCYSVTLK